MNGYFLAIHGNDVKIFDSGDKYMYMYSVLNFIS